MIESVLVANRGEIARRIIRSARSLGVRTIAVHSDLDTESPFVAEADQAVLIPGAAAMAYRDVDALLHVAAATGAEAIHPGYGFLSENADFAQEVIRRGLVWIGPAPDVIATMGDKITARQAAIEAGVPVVPGSDALASANQAKAEAERIGYPVMIKAAGGGGGMGMAVIHDEAAVEETFERISGVAQRLFGDGRVFVERYVSRSRHIEVQVLGLTNGTVLTLGERDCSVQRRNQKLVEECPSPAIGTEMRTRITSAARLLAERVGYRNAGTVEMIFDVERSEFYFLEMNTRIQVEHPVTEAVYGIDLVAAQLAIASGESPEPSAFSANGHAIEFRINAEDSVRFLPRPGTIQTWHEPNGAGIRVDAGYRTGNTVSSVYDSLMAKLVVHGATRDEALARARAALADFVIEGPKSTIELHQDLLASAEFTSGDYDTRIVSRLRPGTK
ncbi:acetyl-CoA carboxylase biotin carboxylase subunit [Streptomyces sp. CA-106131]|uniref:acetyl-CoA carboxylase biotin carboxylase subunit n=1 Tax=Streptomyces sp. CA-106131 TaxID=3240045 RepID=UPI003D90EEF6